MSSCNKTASRKTKDLEHLISSEEWLLAHHRGQECPQEAKSWSIRPMLFGGELPSKVLPIHLACSLRAPDYVLSMLLAEYQKCAGKRESGYGRLPLHVACQSGASVGSIGILLEKYPEGPRTRDSLGRLPLHLVCLGAPLSSLPSSSSSPSPAAPPLQCTPSSWDSCVSVVDALLAMYPEAAGKVDNQGQMPLHVACSAGAPVGAIRLLIDAFPDAVTAETHKGSTPMLHAARLPNSPNKTEIISTLQFMTDVNRLGSRPSSNMMKKRETKTTFTKRKQRYSISASSTKKSSKDVDAGLKQVVRKSHAKLLQCVSESSLLV
uniref:Uncharacterized protein n=1 Tax=Ditylum brightwellii TaxID=49249 RepID=A0A7S1Z5L4_9STRA|mmetsp:Transcript_24908/g.37138  ORF Transcript_24908/g.37138 Transcript_24908/m.37138 type:complete len:321 (+) Transcript_24908:236-1198(+)